MSDLMFVLEQANGGDLPGPCWPSGVSYPHHPDLQAVVEGAERAGLIVMSPPPVPLVPHAWDITDAGRVRLDALWKANGRRGLDAPDFFRCPNCGRMWTFPGDTVACRECGSEEVR